MKKHGVEVHLNTTLSTENVKTLAADTVDLDTGLRADAAFAEEIKALGIPVMAVGDALEAKNGLKNI